jgi:hypothetical protein
MNRPVKRSWQDRVDTFFDVAEAVGQFIGWLLGIAVFIAFVWGGLYMWRHDTIGHWLSAADKWAHEDETGFVQAMRKAGYNDDANEALDAGHRICTKLRSDNSTPTEVVNTITNAAGSSGIDPALLRRMSFEFVTNAQVYLCPDTLHNTGTPTMTPTTPPTPPTTPAPTQAPMVNCATNPVPGCPAPTDGGCSEYTMPDGTCRNCPPSWGEGCLGKNSVPSSIPDNWDEQCRVQADAPVYCPRRGTNEWCIVWPAATDCSVDGRWTGAPPTSTTTVLPTTRGQAI